MKKGNKLIAKADSLKQPKPKKLPEGPSTMSRIAKGGPEVASVAKRNKMRAGKMKKGK